MPLGIFLSIKMLNLPFPVKLWSLNFLLLVHVQYKTSIYLFLFYQMYLVEEASQLVYLRNACKNDIVVCTYKTCTAKI